MAHFARSRAVLQTSVAACVLAAGLAACSSAGTSGFDRGSPDAQLDAGSQEAEPWPADGATPDSAGADGASDSGQQDAGPPPPVTCLAGDRTEFSGLVSNTGIEVAVCSACGKSYVVASTNVASGGQVTVDNGSQTITLSVPAGGTATSSKLADNPSDGKVTVCATGSSQDCLPKQQNQKYCDPFRSIDSLVPERIDQGVDYAGSGPIYAMAPGTIDLFYNRTDSGWPGGTFMSYKLTAGPAKGREIFLAENIDLDTTLHPGSFVYSGTVLGTLVNASPNCEIGWGVAGQGITAEYGCYTEGCTTPLGLNFNKLLVCLKTPSGIENAGGCCSMPSGWPSDWCTPLAAWQ